MKKITLPKSTHRLGYTKKEILDIIRPLKIHHKTFYKKFGVNTGAIGEKGEFLYYGVDILRTISMCLEKRDMYWWEFD